MLKRLKRRFLVASLTAITILIATIITLINVLNYKSVMDRADEILDLIMENDGRFPDIRLDLPLPEDFITAETPYETRFFTVTYSPTGKVHSVNTANIAAVDDEMAVKMADSIKNADENRGLLGNYRYLVEWDYGYTDVIFLDCTETLESFNTFLAFSAAFSFIGIIAVFFFLLVISDKILKPISESYDKQRRFIADAGHDIKTPLTIIDADTELLELEVGQNEWLEDIRRQTERLTSLTTELIYLSKMEEGRRNEFTFFPISDVIEDMAASFGAPAKTKGVSLCINLTPGVYYKGDEAGIKKLMDVLFDNAIKYSPEGTEVSVSLRRLKNGIAICVKNYAADLTQESIEHLFERFYRSDSARSSKGGFGIGLSVAQAIVSAHKGKITAEKDGDYLVIETIM